MKYHDEIFLEIEIGFYTIKSRILYSVLGNKKIEKLKVPIKRIKGINVVSKEIGDYLVTMLVLESHQLYIEFYKKLIREFNSSEKLIFELRQIGFKHKGREIDIFNIDANSIYSRTLWFGVYPHDIKLNYLKNIDNILERVAINKPGISLSPYDFSKSCYSGKIDGLIKKKYLTYTVNPLFNTSFPFEIDFKNFPRKLFVPYGKLMTKMIYKGNTGVQYQFYTIPEEKLTEVITEVKCFVEKCNVKKFLLTLFNRTFDTFYEINLNEIQEISISEGRNFKFGDVYRLSFHKFTWRIVLSGPDLNEENRGCAQYCE